MKAIEKLAERVAACRDINCTFLSSNIAQFCLRGKTGESKQHV